MDREKAVKAVRDFLAACGEDTEREGLKDTPARVADMFAELLSGNGQRAEEHLSKSFSVQSGDMVIEKDITFSSTCEHHLMPFFGKMAIAYIPQGRVAGLSKLRARSKCSQSGSSCRNSSQARWRRRYIPASARAAHSSCARPNIPA